MSPSFNVRMSRKGVRQCQTVSEGGVDSVAHGQAGSVRGTEGDGGSTGQHDCFGPSEGERPRDTGGTSMNSAA